MAVIDLGTGTVYFLQGEEGGRIKIGWSTEPEQRVSALQCGSPQRLRIIHMIRGPQALEAELHTRFDQFREHNEWFAPVPEIYALMGLPVPTSSRAQVRRSKERKRELKRQHDDGFRHGIEATAGWANAAFSKLDTLEATVEELIELGDLLCMGVGALAEPDEEIDKELDISAEEIVKDIQEFVWALHSELEALASGWQTTRSQISEWHGWVRQARERLAR